MDSAFMTGGILLLINFNNKFTTIQGIIFLVNNIEVKLLATGCSRLAYFGFRV